MNNNNNIINSIKKINNEYNIKNKIINIIDIYNKMNEINIIYKINYIIIDDEREKIFGAEFVKNNKNNCEIIYEDKEYELNEYFNISEFKNYELKIKLRGINNIINMSCIFYECSLHYYLYLIFQNGILIKLLIWVIYFINVEI